MYYGDEEAAFFSQGEILNLQAAPEPEITFPCFSIYDSTIG